MKFFRWSNRALTFNLHVTDECRNIVINIVLITIINSVSSETLNILNIIEILFDSTCLLQFVLSVSVRGKENRKWNKHAVKFLKNLNKDFDFYRYRFIFVFVVLYVLFNFYCLKSATINKYKVKPCDALLNVLI